jgi:methenyltetrahydromethanopterin cyclohydrolase
VIFCALEADVVDDDILNEGEVLFEVRQVGNAVKVSAVDPVTNTEVSVMGPVNASPYTLKMNAVRKLRMVLRKNAGG